MGRKFKYRHSMLRLLLKKTFYRFLSLYLFFYNYQPLPLGITIKNRLCLWRKVHLVSEVLSHIHDYAYSKLTFSEYKYLRNLTIALMT